MRVTCVPQVGGRTLEYALGPHNCLFIGSRDLGKTLKDGDERRYRHFGGQFAQLHPEERWARLASGYLPELLMGAYEAKALPADGGTARLEMTSPVDLATGTRLVRTVELFPASSRLRITDTVTNVRPVPQEWGIQAMLQLKGFATESGILRGDERPAGAISLYVPLSPKSRFRKGVSYVVGGERPASAESQWSSDELPGLLRVQYRGEFGKALVDPVLPWVAFVDRNSGCAFVQQCRAADKAILTAGGPLHEYPFIEVQCFGNVARLGPGESTSLVQDWYAARCVGPVVDVTAAGVVSSPLSLLRGEGRTWAAGVFGVFHVGRAALVLQGADGAELSRVDCGPVTPLERFRLNCAVDVSPQVAGVTLEISDVAGKPVGDLGKISLGAR